MSGTAHFQGVNRWPGKPTSGRYVYTYNDGWWYWQCDMCDIYGHESYSSMQEAFGDCLNHVYKCTEGD
ncbi:hypothetical protein SEA_CASSITA_10 [Microbacterium phage Cassita]|nr:hypothetical protein SEA_CASSITA_10 [Microbacterium phage Cassita]